MMMASPTAASAAATVITKKTKTWPATPCTWANATNARFTAFSISSTHMKMMIAFRRVRTPTTPIVNSTAEKNSASASNSPPASRLPEHDRADDGGEEQHARDLERQQVFVEQRLGDWSDHPALGDLPGRLAVGKLITHGDRWTRESEDLRENGQPDRARRESPAKPAPVGKLGWSPQIEQHDH